MQNVRDKRGKYHKHSVYNCLIFSGEINTPTFLNNTNRLHLYRLSSVCEVSSTIFLL